MKVIGQEINIFNPEVYQAMVDRNEAFLSSKIDSMLASQIDGIEINLGGWQTADELLPWLVKLIRKKSSCSIFLSPIPSSLKEAVEYSGGTSIGPKIFVNCVTADRDRLKSMMSACKCLGTGLVVLLTKRGFLPSSLDEICLMAEEVLELAEKKDFPVKKLLLDPVLRPRLSTDVSGKIINIPDITFFAEAIYMIGRLRNEKVPTIAGLSNLFVGASKGHKNSFLGPSIEIFSQAGLDYLIMPSETVLVKKAKNGNSNPSNLFIFAKEYFEESLSRSTV